MRKVILLVVTMLFAVIAAAAAPQDAAKKDAAPKPAKGLSQAVLEQWNDVGRKLIAMAEDFPEDKYDFKPTPAQRSFAEQLLHAANANYYFINPATGKKMPAEEDPKRADYKTKAAVVAFVKKSFEDGAAAIKMKGDKGLSDLGGGSICQSAGARFGHGMGSAGALRRTLRTAGGVLPSGRAGTAGIATEESGRSFASVNPS